MSLGGLEIADLVDVEPLGADPVGQSFVATDRKLDRRVAVRVLAPPATESEAAQLLEAATTVAALSTHPNLVTIYDTGLASDGRPYLVMELTDGPSLADRIGDGPLAWPEACGLALQLSAGLAQLHEAGRTHGDLRPEHVVLAGSMAKLSEIVRLRGIGGPDDPEQLVHRAPEALRRDGDERSDLYALTSILYQMIEGQAAFWRPNDSTAALQARVLTQSAPRLDPDLVPPALAVFVAAGLSADPLDRPQTAAEFSRELELIRLGRTTGSTPSVLHAPSAPAPAVTAPTIARGPRTDEVDLTGIAGGGPGLPDSWPPPGQTGSNFERIEGLGGAVEVGGPGPTGSRPGSVRDLGRTTVGDLRPPPLAVGVPPSEPAPTDPTMVADAFPLIGEPGPATPGRRGPVERSPLWIGAIAMVIVGLAGLAVVAALSFGGSSSTDGSAAPQLPDPDAPTVADGAPAEGSPTSLAPLAMMEDATTTTLSDEKVTSTDTSLVRAPVPNVVNLDVEGAGQLLSEQGFEVLVVGRVSPGSLPGTVIQQTPAAGTTIELPATVTLFIPRSTVLPFMVGRPAETVCLQLTALGLECAQTLRFDDRVPAGAVIATDPVEGQTFSEGQTIRLTVSRGPLVEVAVPQVAGQAEDEATMALTDLGFDSVSTRSEPSESVPSGQAIATEPAAGTNLAVDQPVVIIVSSGPAPMVAVPDLVGLDQAAAETALGGAQLSAAVVERDLPVGDPGIGQVLASDPPAGTEILVGSTVNVTVGREAPATTTTMPPAGDSTTTSTG